VTEQRVVVVGAGVLGLFTAWELVKAGGVNVTVIDGSHPGDGSSGRSVGMVEAQYLSRPEVEVRAYGLDVYCSLERDYGISFAHGGYLRLGRDETDAKNFAASAQLQAEFGLTDVIMLSKDEMGARWPRLITDDLHVGMLGEIDGHVDGHEVCQLLVRLVRDAGGSVHSKTRLRSADRDSSGAWTLQTDSSTFVADVVVNAAGGWAGEVGDLLGGPVTLLPQLSGALALHLTPPMPLTPFTMDYVPGSGVEGVWFRSEGDGQLIAGTHSDEPVFEPVSPDVHLGSMSGATVEKIMMRLAGRLHDVDDMRAGLSWTGIYPTSPDYDPIVGPHSSMPGLVCALGAGGAGIQLAPAIGRLAADAVLERGSSGFGDGLNWSQGR
jgi:sarcosine oxidase subunit beta